MVELTVLDELKMNDAFETEGEEKLKGARREPSCERREGYTWSKQCVE